LDWLINCHTMIFKLYILTAQICDDSCGFMQR